MRRHRSLKLLVLIPLALGTATLGRADDDPPEKKKDPAKADGDKKGEKDEGESRVAPEARLCFKIADGEVIKGIAIEPYLDLLTEENTEAWNKRRKKDKGKVLDLAGKLWEPKKREDLALKLEGLDLSGADLSNVIFMPGTSFKGSDLSGASFRGSCLEGVTFSSIQGFEAREPKKVRSTCVDEADFRDAIWTWDTALEKTARRCREEPAKAVSPAEKQRRAMERAERMRMRGYGSGEDPFAFVDTETVKADADSPLAPPDDETGAGAGSARRDRPPQPLQKLVRAAAADTIERAIEKLVARRSAVKSKECPNPLAHEAALAEAVAAADSRLVGIASWKAVRLADPTTLRPDDVTVVGGKDVLFVVDDERALANARLVVSEGPIMAWGRGVLPTTFTAHPIVLKDQANVRGVLHAHPVFALSDPLRNDKTGRRGIQGGTFRSEVVVEVAKVENLSLQECEMRSLKEGALKEFARSHGDDLEHLLVYDPTEEDGTDPETTLPKEMRKAILSAAGKDAFSGMKCYKVGAHKFTKPGNTAYWHVLSEDKKAIIVVTPEFSSNGSVYSEGPVVFLDGDKTPHPRCVTKSWLVVEGQHRRVQQFLSVGERIDVDPKAAPEDDK